MFVLPLGCFLNEGLKKNKSQPSIQCCGSDPGSGTFLTTGFGIRIRDPGWKKIQIQDPGSGMNIPDLIFEDLTSVSWVKNT
jgi:hypothetical protein